MRVRAACLPRGRDRGLGPRAVVTSCPPLRFSSFQTKKFEKGHKTLPKKEGITSGGPRRKAGVHRRV